MVLANFEEIARYSYTESGGVNNYMASIACHTRIRCSKPGEIRDFVTNITGTTDGAEEILKYILWKDGPFRQLIEIPTAKPWVIYHDNGSPRALGIPDEVMSYKCFPLVYALLILSRFPSEFKGNVKAFKKLLSFGMDPHEALLLSRRLGVDNSESLVTTNLTWSGSHTHINENVNGLDWKMYISGNHHPRTYSDFTGLLWAVKDPRAQPKTAHFEIKVFTKVLKTRFTEVTCIPEENIPRLIETFNKWLKERFIV